MKKKIAKVATGRVGSPVVLSLEYLQAKKKFSLFEGLSRDEYEAKIKGMSNCDISTYAAKIGLRPTGERRMLTMNLLKEYDNAARALQRYGDESFAAVAPETREVNENYETFIAAFKS